MNEKKEIHTKKTNKKKVFKLKKKSLLKSKITGMSKSAGRNNSGKITCFHKGGGHKTSYRKINFNRTEISKGIICSIEYDPNRTSNIASVFDYTTNDFFYIIAPKKLSIGDIVESGINAEPKLGNSLPLEQIPVGSYIYNIAPKINKSAQISRSAGTFSILKEKTLTSAIIELSSGEQRLISPKCYATIGIVSNEFSFLKKHEKAGQLRWLNKRPTVRGVAMNPIDHPHGGGEGKKSGLNKTPWGKSNNLGSTSTSTNKNIIKTRNE
jgi:large subunit ribosomal protein L2